MSSNNKFMTTKVRIPNQIPKQSPMSNGLGLSSKSYGPHAVTSPN